MRYHPDPEPLGLPPIYEATAWKTPLALRLIGYALAVLAVLIVATIALGRLDAPTPFGMTCWETGDHNGAVVCSLQAPDGATGQEG